MRLDLLQPFLRNMLDPKLAGRHRAHLLAIKMRLHGT